MSVAVDGFIEGPERELDWHKLDELHRHFNEQLGAMDAFLMGGRHLRADGRSLADP